MHTYICTICGYIYDEAAGIPGAGIAPGTVWDALPAQWVCPLCGASKDAFKLQESAPKQAAPAAPLDESAMEGPLSVGVLAAVCSNLARGCRQQYLDEEAACFTEIADWFTARIPAPETPVALKTAVQADLDDRFPAAFSVSQSNADRGALRALTWTEKVTRIGDSLLARSEKDGEAMPNLFVCEVCGFIYAGDEPPAQCPVCKVPSWKFRKIERR